MPGHRLWRVWIPARSILVGWITLIALTYIIERPLLFLMTPLLGASWLPTAKVSLEALALAATGWAIGRLHRSAPIPGVLAFAATLCFRELEPLLSINVPWLMRLAADAFRDTRYLGSFAATAAQQVFLFGSLIVGALLGRPWRPPASLFRSAER